MTTPVYLRAATNAPEAARALWHHRIVSSPDLDRLARTAYEAHCAAQPGSAPPWDEITAQDKKAWRAAVSAVTSQGDSTVADGVPTQALVVQAGDQTHIFHKDFTVGRQGSLPINDEHASSHHALFQAAHQLWYVEDLNSTNGTFLNNRRIFSAQRLKRGDKVKIGRTVITVLSV
jgi:pSer/pThr/pTyr-binding forkhead associated (FHA) protein